MTYQEVATKQSADLGNKQLTDSHITESQQLNHCSITFTLSSL